MSKILGIDLGTTNSAMAVMEGSEPEILVNAEGDRTTPSVEGFRKDGERVVGKAAKNQAVTNPENTVSSVKRFIGRSFAETQAEQAKVSYKVQAGKDGRTVVDIDGKDYTPEEISAMVLQKLKNDAEKQVGSPITQAVITVPAYFNDAQRQATKDAGKIAGLEVLRIINEPTAAALAYGLDKTNKDEKILVFDLGGGTFDVSILELGDGVFEVAATAGDNQLGGDDWDHRVIDWLADKFAKDNGGIDLRKDKMALQRLKEAAEKAKMELSSTTQANINLPFITADATGPKHLDYTLTRAEFESITKDLLDRCRKPVEQALQRRRYVPGRYRRGHPGRRLHPYARRAGAGEAHDRQAAEHVREPGRGRCHGRCRPGRRARRRRRGHPAAGRHAPVPGRGDHGRHHDEDDRPQHHHPHPQDRGVLHGS